MSFHPEDKFHVILDALNALAESISVYATEPWAAYDGAFWPETDTVAAGDPTDEDVAVARDNYLGALAAAQDDIIRKFDTGEPL